MPGGAERRQKKQKAGDAELRSCSDGQADHDVDVDGRPRGPAPAPDRKEKRDESKSKVIGRPADRCETYVFDLASGSKKSRCLRS